MSNIAQEGVQIKTLSFLAGRCFINNLAKQKTYLHLNRQNSAIPKLKQFFGRISEQNFNYERSIIAIKSSDLTFGVILGAQLGKAGNYSKQILFAELLRHLASLIVNQEEMCLLKLIFPLYFDFRLTETLFKTYKHEKLDFAFPLTLKLPRITSINYETRMDKLVFATESKELWCFSERAYAPSTKPGNLASEGSNALSNENLWRLQFHSFFKVVPSNLEIVPEGICGRKRLHGDVQTCLDLRPVYGQIWYSKYLSQYDVICLTSDGFICRWYQTRTEENQEIWKYQQQGPFLWLNFEQELRENFSTVQVVGCDSEFLVLNNYKSQIQIIHSFRDYDCGQQELKLPLAFSHSKGVKLIGIDHKKDLNLCLYSNGQVFIKNAAKNLVFSSQLELPIELCTKVKFWTDSLLVISNEECLRIYKYCVDYSQPTLTLLRVIYPSQKFKLSCLSQCKITDVIVKPSYLNLVVNYCQKGIHFFHLERVLDFTRSKLCQDQLLKLML